MGNVYKYHGGGCPAGSTNQKTHEKFDMLIKLRSYGLPNCTAIPLVGLCYKTVAEYKKKFPDRAKELEDTRAPAFINYMDKFNSMKDAKALLTLMSKLYPDVLGKHREEEVRVDLPDKTTAYLKREDVTAVDKIVFS